MKGAQLKTLNAASIAEFKELIQLFNMVFETGTSKCAADKVLLKLLSNPAFICIVAMVDNKVVGGLTAYEMPSYSGNYSEAYIYDIAVATEHQRIGIGIKLIDALKKHCKQRNIKTLFVEAHEEDIGAVNFYHRTKAKAEKVMHFNYYL